MLLFLNSPFSVICNLVGLVGEMPLRACMLYLSFSCVSALMRRALAASREAMRFSCGQRGCEPGPRRGRTSLGVHLRGCGREERPVEQGARGGGWPCRHKP